MGDVVVSEGAQGVVERLVGAYEAAVDRVHGGRLVREALAGERGRYDAVLALGKAARGMRDAAVEVLGGVEASLVVCGDGAPARGAHEVWIGEHPVPGAGSFAAGARALAWAEYAAVQQWRVLGLVSGGASALCDAPTVGLGAAEVALAQRALVASGAPIAVINAARRRLSAVKGGGLLRVLRGGLGRLLVVVDVPDGDPRVVGSGPLCAAAGPDARDASALLGRGEWSAALRAALARTVEPSAWPAGPRAEALVTPGEFAVTLGQCVADRGFEVRGAPRVVEGPVDEVAREIVRHLRGEGGAWVAAGEVSVRVPEGVAVGAGGRARHLALAVKVAMAREAPRRRWAMLAAGSDGCDGAGAAGAVVTGEDSVEGAAEALAAFASGAWCERRARVLPQRATQTNVTDAYVAVAQ